MTIPESTSKTRIEGQEVLRFLQADFDRTISSLCPIQGGEHSQAFSFQSSGRNFVVRVTLIFSSKVAQKTQDLFFARKGKIRSRAELALVATSVEVISVNFWGQALRGDSGRISTEALAKKASISKMLRVYRLRWRGSRKKSHLMDENIRRADKPYGIVPQRHRGISARNYTVDIRENVDSQACIGVYYLNEELLVTRLRCMKVGNEKGLADCRTNGPNTQCNNVHIMKRSVRTRKTTYA